MAQDPSSMHDELVKRYQVLVLQVDATLPEELTGDARIAALRAAVDEQALKDVEAYATQADAELQHDEDMVRVELGKVPDDTSAALSALNSL